MMLQIHEIANRCISGLDVKQETLNKPETIQRPAVVTRHAVQTAGMTGDKLVIK